MTYLAIAYFTVGLMFYVWFQVDTRRDARVDPEFDEDPTRWWDGLGLIPLWFVYLLQVMFNRKDNR
jgi:hypothetical protein